jgi:hypothetical protein
MASVYGRYSTAAAMASIVAVTGFDARAAADLSVDQRELPLAAYAMP